MVRTRACLGPHVTRDPNRRILVVDDNLDSGLIISLLLEGAGWSTVSKSNVRDALDALDDDANIGFVVTDVRMPDYDGFDLLRVVKHRFPHLPVILITGQPLVPDDVIPLRAVVLEKPLSAKELLGAIEKNLACA